MKDVSEVLTTGDDILCRCASERDSADLRDALARLGQQSNDVKDRADKHKVLYEHGDCKDRVYKHKVLHELLPF